MFYIGKTKGPFQKRIRNHVYYVPKLSSPIGRHIGLKHNYNTLAMSFMALDHVREDPRGGDFDTARNQMDSLLKGPNSPRVK